MSGLVPLIFKNCWKTHTREVPPTSKKRQSFFTFVIDPTFYQAEYRPRADHPVWQHADKCHPTWTKTYGGSCLVQQCNVISFVIILYFLAPLSVICLLSLFSPYLQDMVTKH